MGATACARPSAGPSSSRNETQYCHSAIHLRSARGRRAPHQSGREHLPASSPPFELADCSFSSACLYPASCRAALLPRLAAARWAILVLTEASSPAAAIWATRHHRTRRRQRYSLFIPYCQCHRMLLQSASKRGALTSRGGLGQVLSLLAHDHQVSSRKNSFRCIRCRRLGHQEWHCHFRSSSRARRVKSSVQCDHPEQSET